VSSSTAELALPRPRGRTRLAWALFVIAAGFMVVGVAFLVRDYANGTFPARIVISQLSLLPPALAYSLVGFAVALRRPSHPAGWLMLAIGLVWSLGVGPPTPAGATITWLSSPFWVPPFGLMGTHLLLRLPNGRLPSERWRIVSRLSTAAIVVTVFGLFFDPETKGNPIANRGLALIGLIGLITLAGCIVASIVSLFVRRRRASSVERQQLRWIAAGGLVFFLGWAASFFVDAVLGVKDGTLASAIVGFFTLSAYAAVPISIGLAILRYRLFEIDVVIRKAVIVAVLAVFFTAVYVAIVGGVGAAVGSKSTPALSFLAAALVAIGIQPVVSRARRFADRVVYGERATPYEVLSDFGKQLGGTYAADDVLPRIARVLHDGIGATRARVLLHVGDELREVAAWPPEEPTTLADDSVVEVRDQGEVLGALGVSMPANDPIDDPKAKLVADLAAQAGLVLRNVRLVEELRASQRRIVTAQDHERRRLERNIHDGAQQQLVALAVKARLARSLVDRDTDKAGQMLEQIGVETQDALENLRDLARGIYPPLLADKGLVPALEAQARKAAMPVEISPDGIERYPQEIEGAVYFSILEALQNAAKYSRASRVAVRLGRDGAGLSFEVADDGVGFDPDAAGFGTGLQGIGDRLSALDGRLTVRSSPGSGTTIGGWVPARVAERDRP
jgi:signal transduction histidine kinase